MAAGKPVSPAQASLPTHKVLPATFSVNLPYVLLSDLKSEQQAPERHLLGHLWGNAALASPHQQLWWCCISTAARIPGQLSFPDDETVQR